MIRGMAILLLLLLVGDLLAAGLNLPVPGSVVGMGLLLLALAAGIVRIAWVEEAAELLLSHLALFFVPAGVGVMLYFDLIGREWLPILGSIVISSFAVMAVTGWTVRWLDKRSGNRVE